MKAESLEVKQSAFKSLHCQPSTVLITKDRSPQKAYPSLILLPSVINVFFHSTRWRISFISFELGNFLRGRNHHLPG